MKNNPGHTMQQSAVAKFMDSLQLESQNKTFSICAGLDRSFFSI